MAAITGKGTKRRADVPREAHTIDVSKADLLEAAWELAALSNDTGVDDNAATMARLIAVLNGARERSGRKPLRLS